MYAYWALYTGGVLQAIAFPIKTGPVGNGIAIWLGIQPADLFLYIFLPPMLVDSAVRIDYFIFRKVCAFSLLRGIYIYADAVCKGLAKP